MKIPAGWLFNPQLQPLTECMAAIDETWSLKTELKQIMFTGQSDFQKVQVKSGEVRQGEGCLC